jgi:hypothetical protein
MARQEADISALTTPRTQWQQALALQAEFKIPTQTFTTGPAIMPWGDPMILPKPETTTRLIFANVNGLGSTGLEKLCILDAFRALDLSIIGITETQLDTTKYGTTTRPFLRHFKSLWQHNSTLLADSKETFTNSWKPGGVAQIVVGGSKIRLRKADRDPSGMGRWASHTLVGTNGIPLTIITSYRVSQSYPLAVGALTAAQQQWRHLARHNQPNFISDIIKFIKQLQRNHHDIYLMGNLNESEGAAPIQRIYNKCNLVSVPPTTRGNTPWSHLHSRRHQPRPSRLHPPYSPAHTFIRDSDMPQRNVAADYRTATLSPRSFDPLEKTSAT